MDRQMERVPGVLRMAWRHDTVWMGVHVCVCVHMCTYMLVDNPLRTSVKVKRILGLGQQSEDKKFLQKIIVLSLLCLYWGKKINTLIQAKFCSVCRYVGCLVMYLQDSFQSQGVTLHYYLIDFQGSTKN